MQININVNLVSITYIVQYSCENCNLTGREFETETSFLSLKSAEQPTLYMMQSIWVNHKVQGKEWNNLPWLRNKIINYPYPDQVHKFSRYNTYHVRQQNLVTDIFLDSLHNKNKITFKIGSSIQNKSQIIIIKQRKPCRFCMTIILQMFTNILKHVIQTPINDIM